MKQREDVCKAMREREKKKEMKWNEREKFFKAMSMRKRERVWIELKSEKKNPRNKGKMRALRAIFMYRGL